MTFSDLPFELRMRIFALANQTLRRDAFARRCSQFELRHWMVYQKKMMLRPVQTLNPAARIVFRWSYHTSRYSIDEIIPAPQFALEPYYRHCAHSTDSDGCLLYTTSSRVWSSAVSRPMNRAGRCRLCRERPRSADWRCFRRPDPAIAQRKITDFFRDTVSRRVNVK
jgi:hypothetical protein